MTSLRQDLAYALRTFGKTPGFTAIAVLVLGVGIGANTAIFSVVNQISLKPLSGRTGELLGLYSHDRTRPDSYRAFSYANYADIRDNAALFESLMAHTFSMVGTPDGDGTRRTFAELISANYFETLGVPLAAGRAFTLDEERPGARIPVAIVPFSRAHELGRAIRVNNTDYTVVGVAPRGFTGTMAIAGADLYLPLGVFDDVVNDLFKNNDKPFGDRANPTLVLAGRVREGVSREALAARLETASRQLEQAYPADNKNQLMTVHPLPRMGVSTSPGTDTGLNALAALMLGMSAVVLVIACLNLANMLLARGAARAKEISVRLALGAARTRVIRQLLTESLVLAVAGGGLGLLLSYLATRALSTSLAGALPLQVNFVATPDWRVLAATMAFAALSTVAFGLGPALKVSRRDLVSDLKARGADAAGSRRRFSARNLMVVAQVSLSLALLTAGGIFARTAVNAASATPGYSYERLTLATLDGSIGGYDEARSRHVYRDILQRLRSHPSVEAATIASSVPFGDTHEGELLERVGAPERSEPSNAREYRIIGAGYFTSLGIRMVRGREFTPVEEQSPSAPRVVILDEILARDLFGTEDPIGQMVRVAERPGEPVSAGHREPMQVVGIAPPIRAELLQSGPVSHVYVPLGRAHRGTMHVQARMRPGLDAVASTALLRQEIRGADVTMPILALSTMNDFHAKSLELWALRAGAGLFTGLGVVALLLAVMGVYGVKSYVVSQRTREIGIRMALGASARDVLRQMLRDGVALTAAGIAVGLPLAALISIAMSSVFVDIGGLDVGVVATATVVLAAAASAATLIPARRAARIEPLIALRSD